MTQPVQEPSQGRTDQAQEFRTRQLFRRPAPPLSGKAQGMVPKYTFNGPDMYTMFSSPLNGYSSFVVDETAPWGAYVSAVIDGQDIQFGMPLGPAGTAWGVTLCVEMSDNKGKIQLEWATTPTDEVNNSTPAAGTTLSIADPSETSPTYYISDGGPLSSLIDCYSASPASWQFFDMRAVSVITGADGEMLTANTGSSPDFFYGEEMNGGGDSSVYWWLRLRTDGKNASSSGYNTKIAGVQVYRVNGNGQPIT